MWLMLACTGVPQLFTVVPQLCLPLKCILNCHKVCLLVGRVCCGLALPCHGDWHSFIAFEI